MRKRTLFYGICSLTLALSTACEENHEPSQSDDETPCCESCLPEQSCENCVCTGTPGKDNIGNSNNDTQTPNENNDVPCDPACTGDNVCHHGSCVPQNSCEIAPCTPDSLCIQHKCSEICAENGSNVGYDILIGQTDDYYYDWQDNQVNWAEPGMKILNSAEDLPAELSALKTEIAWEQVSPDEMIVLLWAGEKGSTGYRMHINKVCKNTEIHEIHIIILFCAKENHNDAMTWPHMVIKVPKGEYSPVFTLANNACFNK